MRYAIAAVLALGAMVFLPGCAGNDTRADDNAMARERAAEERGRRDAEEEARRQQAARQRRAPVGVGSVELPEPSPAALPSGLVR